jgi:large subunit ribosomal protein L21
MYAIVELKGEQFRVENGTTIYSPLTDNEEGQDITIDKVLFVNNDGETVVGNPYIDGAKVTGKIEKLVKGNKINLFKYKRRKNYQRRIGHRPKFHKITISSIDL